MPSSSYFVRTGPSTYLATEHTGGAWDITEQHIAPTIGLIAHLMEADFAARRDDEMHLARISYDIFGTMPVAEVSYETRVLRAGRTIELLEVSLFCEGRQIVAARGWFMAPGETSTFAGSDFPAIPPLSDHEEWHASSAWPGAALKELSCRRLIHAPGRGSFWLSTTLPLVDDAPTSTLAHAAGLLDFANGMVARANPGEVAFPNLDLTVHFFRPLTPGPLGFDTTVSFGPAGVGLTHSVLHDTQGPVGVSSQSLTVRPMSS